MLARHSAITLTMAVYTHVDLNDAAKAVECLECPLALARGV